MPKLNGRYPKYPKNITPIFRCSFFLQEPLVTRLPIIVACHLPPKIVIMTRTAVETVLWFWKAAGGITIVTTPIWMVCTSMVKTTLKEWTGAFGKTLITQSRGLRWRYVQKIFETFLALCVKWSLRLWRSQHFNNRHLTLNTVKIKSPYC